MHVHAADACLQSPTAVPDQIDYQKCYAKPALFVLACFAHLFTVHHIKYLRQFPVVLCGGGCQLNAIFTVAADEKCISN